MYNDGDREFEYKYLFGTNGLEKMSRLNKVRKIRQTCYDLDFFYSDSLHLGHLLIYGIAFGRAEFLSDDFLEQYPEYENIKLVSTVDGHILQRLESRYQNKQLEKVTLAYYSEADKENYTKILGCTELMEITELKKCDEVIRWTNIKIPT